MFVHLHNHSEYSLLNGSIRVPDLVKKAKEYGMPAVALTDYGNMFGAVDFFLEAKKAGIQPILGCTVYHPSNDQHDLRSHRRGIDQLFNLVLLVQNETGYKNICKLLTKSFLDGFYYKPRVDSKLLAQYSEGLIALSGGWDGAMNHALFEGNAQKARQAAQSYSKIFPGRFYVELQENGIEGQHESNLELLKIASELDLPVVATNNCHYLTRDEAEAFEMLLCIQTGGTLQGSGDHLKYSTDGYYFKTADEIEETFAYAPQAVKNTLKIAQACAFELDLKNYYFPKFDPPAGKTLDEFLVDQAREGLEERWGDIWNQRTHAQAQIKGAPPLNETDLKKGYVARLELELEMIQKMGFSGYFLIVSDFIRYAKNQKIPVGPGRGSAAGSLVAYCVQITDLDPLPYNLLFERFLNPERISMPDVDIDFCMHGRARVLEYVAQKYGNVSQIITFGKMKAKAVLRDVGRVMEIPYEEVDKIAKLVPNQLNITLEDAMKIEPRFKELAKANPQVERLLEIARKLEGLNRHASTHAAGVVISDRPLSDFLPLYKGGNNDIVTQYDMKAVEKVGLIKFDFLGLKTLTVIQDALKIIERTHGVSLDMLQVPLDDEKVYALLSKGDTAGVFQLESSGMKDLLTRMKPSCFEDLVALVALYRPGPLGSGMVDDFINRKQGKTPIVYDLPQLQKILEDTYGVIVYQEQVMQIAAVLGGYSLGEADILRRAMGKKKAEEMAAQRERFLKGCQEKKVNTQKAEKIFDLMAKFAEYGFNKSHSAAYALVSYQTAYLKAHYPAEYLAAVLTTELNDTDRVLYYINDCREHGIQIAPPDVNESFYGFSVVKDDLIRYGMGAVKGVGEGAIQSIVDSRKKQGSFKSFFDFCNTVDMHRVNRRVLESLIKCGAFDQFSPSRAALFNSIDSAVDVALRTQEEEGIGQTNLFNLIQRRESAPIGLKLTDTPEWGEHERLAFEKEALGFYFSGHPLKSYEAEIRRVATHDTLGCQAVHAQADVVIAGMISQSKVITTKKGARMAFATFEDLKGNIEAIFFSDVYQKSFSLFGVDKPIVIKGSIDRAEEGVKLIVREAVLLTEYLSQKTKSVHFKIPSLLFTEDRLKSFHDILGQHPGACRSYLHLIEPGISETILELPQKLNLENPETLTSRVNALFKEKVVEYGI